MATKTLTEKKQLEIANICYANVAGLFAMFCNERYRGPNFKWENFAKMMEWDADSWIMIHGVRGDRPTIIATAQNFAREIAERLVDRAEFLK